MKTSSSESKSKSTMTLRHREKFCFRLPFWASRRNLDRMISIFFFLSSLFPTSPPVNFFLFLPLFIHTFFWTSYITITAIYSTLRILHCLRLSHDMTWSPTPVLVWRVGGGGNKTPKPTRLFSLAALKKQQDNNWKKMLILCVCETCWVWMEAQRERSLVERNENTRTPWRRKAGKKKNIAYISTFTFKCK